MDIMFSRRVDDRCVTRIRRPDRVVVEMTAYDRKWRTPHDMAHAVTERELGLDQGVFGSIGSGAMFKSMRVVEGRPKHDAAERSARVLRANTRAITLAEVMAGLVHHAVETGQTAPPLAIARDNWGMLEAAPFPWTAEDLGRAMDLLRGLTDRWVALSPSDEITLSWPDRLVLPTPAAPRKPRERTRRR